MSAVPLRRRIPPKTAEELASELMEANADMSAYDAHILGKQMHEAMMEEIYRLARIGEEAEIAAANRKDLIIHWLERDPREPFHG